jgi:hypothetical protein
MRGAGRVAAWLSADSTSSAATTRWRAGGSSAPIGCSTTSPWVQSTAGSQRSRGRSSWAWPGTWTRSRARRGAPRGSDGTAAFRTWRRSVCRSRAVSLDSRSGGRSGSSPSCVAWWAARRRHEPSGLSTPGTGRRSSVGASRSGRARSSPLTRPPLSSSPGPTRRSRSASTRTSRTHCACSDWCRTCPRTCRFPGTGVPPRTPWRRS